MIVALLLLVGERAVMTSTHPAGTAVETAAEPTTTKRGTFVRGWRRRPRPTTTTTAPTTTLPPAAPTTTRPPTTATTVAPPPATTTTVRPTTTTAAATTTTVRPTTTTAAPPGGRFATLPPGTALPSGATCATRVRPAAEVRAVNATYNATAGTRANTLYPRADGAYTGTTDQILQWVACKWGLDEDVVRAQIAVESWWDQRAVGDNGESFGLGQVRVPYHGTAFVDDNAKRSSAYNVDYTYAHWRSCYEGEMTWLNTVERGATYVAGDAWGCLGVWFSGRWHTAAAEGYIAKVKDYLAQRVWTTPGFIG
jgi:hypothetical protein